jgi:PIN domain nuclease of toxin-antitoxin system
VRPAHISVLAALPDIHRDPFDRMLVAQSIAEGLAILSIDDQIGAYGVKVVW